MNKTVINKLALLLAILSIVFGIIECILPLIIIGMVLGLVSIVFGTISIKENKNKSILSIILGSCGFIISLIWLYFFIIVK